MVARVHRHAGPDDAEAAAGLLRRGGLQPREWSNGPGDRYGWHEHAYDKLLYCVDGSITFHTHDGDFSLAAGDRLEIPAGTQHAATVGTAGVRCVEGGG